MCNLEIERDGRPVLYTCVWESLNTWSWIKYVMSINSGFLNARDQIYYVALKSVKEKQFRLKNSLKINYIWKNVWINTMKEPLQ